jgi:hypothetical protein
VLRVSGAVKPVLQCSQHRRERAHLRFQCLDLAALKLHPPQIMGKFGGTEVRSVGSEAGRKLSMLNGEYLLKILSLQQISFLRPHIQVIGQPHPNSHPQKLNPPTPSVHPNDRTGARAPEVNCVVGGWHPQREPSC